MNLKKPSWSPGFQTLPKVRKMSRNFVSKAGEGAGYSDGRCTGRFCDWGLQDLDPRTFWRGLLVPLSCPEGSRRQISNLPSESGVGVHPLLVPARLRARTQTLHPSPCRPFPNLKGKTYDVASSFSQINWDQLPAVTPSNKACFSCLAPVVAT